MEQIAPGFFGLSVHAESNPMMEVQTSWFIRTFMVLRRVPTQRNMGPASGHLTVRVTNNTGDGVECSDARENTIEVTLGKHLLLSGEITRIGYSVEMSILLRKIVR